MSLSTKIFQENRFLVVKLIGQLNYSFAIPLRKSLLEAVTNSNFEKIYLDLSEVEFVGSSGILHFVETIKTIFTIAPKKIGIKKIQPEFVQIFKIYNLHLVEEKD